MDAYNGPEPVASQRKISIFSHLQEVGKSLFPSLTSPPLIQISIPLFLLTNY
ncbi:hypothetical protein TanjilG_01554 [Lupinus angustifolius]|nr:hypothetical protein TanjilG_01554 [Lupinus angustifolius]